MKKLLSFLFFVAILFGLQSCIYVENGDDLLPRGNASRTYDFKNFTALKMGEAFHVHVSSGANFSVTANGELNDLDDLQLYVQDGVLVGKYSRGWFSRRQRLDIDVVMPVLTAVEFSGAADADISGFSNLNKIEIVLSGATRCDFDGTVKTLAFDLSGASRLDLAGTAQYLDGSLSGGSQLHGFDFPAQESVLDLSGASMANVQVSRLLDVEASGASAVRYKGNPVVQKQLSGASTVRQE